MQTPELLVEIGEAGRDPDNLAVALEGGLRHRDRAGQRDAEFLRAALRLAARRQFEKFRFGALDLLGRGIVEIVLERLVDDVLTDRDQLAPQIEIVDRAPVMLGVDDRHGRVDEMGEILRAADIGQRPVLVEQVFQRDRVGDQAALDQLADRGVDAPMHRIAEMFLQQELGDPVIGRIVDQHGAQQRLFGLGIGWWLTESLKVGLGQRQQPDGRRAFHGERITPARPAPRGRNCPQAVELGDRWSQPSPRNAGSGFRVIAARPAAASRRLRTRSQSSM